ncbi:MAG TPA: T9SS type A sorting domain-containing protein, partial [Flavobacteriales bacterium]|nr:T9SS type A sorting domain-containing protein [Flavobacteriales bacterium]
NDLNVYPNPAQHQVVIQFDGDRIVELDLFSPDGRRMLHQAVNDRAITVDIDALAAGIYTVRVRASRGSIHHTNLIKR